MNTAQTPVNPTGPEGEAPSQSLPEQGLTPGVPDLRATLSADTGQEVFATPQSGLDRFIDSLGHPTPDQTSLLEKFRTEGGDYTPEIRQAADAERRERIGENLPGVVEFYKGVFQGDLTTLRADLASSEPGSWNYDRSQHAIKVQKDLLKLFDFQSDREGLTDEQAQEQALNGLFKIMLYDRVRGGRLGGQNNKILSEENKIKNSGNPRSREIKQKLASLYEVAGRDGILMDDLASEFDYNPFSFKDPKYSRLIPDYRVAESMSMEQVVAADMDPDYTRAYYTDSRFGSATQSREQVWQRITSKWEAPSTPTPQPTSQVAA